MTPQDVVKQLAARTSEQTYRAQSNGEAAPELRIALLKLGRAAGAALDVYPEQACGVLVGFTDGDTTVVEHVIPARNVTKDAASDCYQVDPEDTHRADRFARANGFEVVGIWHSHPDIVPVPSRTDLARAWPGYSYLIITVAERRSISLRSWRLQDELFVEEKVTR